MLSVQRRLFDRPFAPPSGPAQHRSVMPLEPSELDDVLAQVDAADSHGSSVGLRLGNGLSWRIMALAGMEAGLLRIKDILGLLSANGHQPLYRIILTSTGARNRKAPTPPLRDDAIEKGDGWRHSALPQVDVYFRDDTPDAICDVQTSATDASKDDWLPQVLCPVYTRVIDAGGAILHAASVERNGEAYLLPGKSGIGKSTCCRRIQPPWQALCDDLTLAIPGRDGGFIIHPLPTWSAILWNEDEAASRPIEHATPLRALFFPEQATEDEALVMGQAEASVQLWRSARQGMISWNGSRDAASRRRMSTTLLNTMSSIVKNFPAFRLRVAKDGTFWREMERVLGAV